MRLWVFHVVLWFARSVLCSISNPLASDINIGDVINGNRDFAYGSTVYHIQDPTARSDGFSQWKHKDAGVFVDDAECKLNLIPKWSSRISDVVLGSPSCYPAFINGKTQLVAFTMKRYIELLDESGKRPYGWPLGVRNQKFFSSPLYYDIDNDGKEEIGAISFDGLISWIKVCSVGELLGEYSIHLPGLFVKKNWFVGLDDATEDQKMMYGVNHAGFSYFDTMPEDSPDSLSIDGHLSFKEIQPVKFNSSQDPARRRLQSDTPDTYFGGDDLFPQQADPDSSQPAPQDFNYAPYGPAHSYYYAYSHHNRFEQPEANASEMVRLDAHVLASAVLYDINNDHEMEVIVPISYFFDSTVYNVHETGPGGVNISNYVAGGLACYSVSSKMLWWNVHLDLTTDLTRFRAYIHTSPVIADIDGDERPDVIIGTSLGLLYVLDGYNGQCKYPFPLQFGEIESSLVVADVVGTSDLEIILGDMNGNLVCVKSDGGIVWERQLHGPITQSATVGDVNSDGNLDVCVSVTDTKGRILVFAVDGRTGKDLSKYPILLDDDVVGDHYPISPVFLRDFHSYGSSKRNPMSSGSAVSLDVLQSIAGALSPSEWDELTKKSMALTSVSISEIFRPTTTTKYIRRNEPNNPVPLEPVLNSTTPENRAYLEGDDDFARWNTEQKSVTAFNKFISVLGNKISGNDVYSSESGVDGVMMMIRSGQWLNEVLKELAMTIKLSKLSDENLYPALSMVNLDSILHEIALSHHATDIGSMTNGKGLHLLLTTHNGHLYAIDGKSGCVQNFPLGSHQCSPPLIADFDVDGFSDIVLSSCSREISALSFSSPESSVFDEAYPSTAIHVISPSVGLVNFFSRTMMLEFEVVDNRLNMHSMERQYHISVVTGVNGELKLLFDKTYDSPGIYEESVQLPLENGKNVLILRLRNDHGQVTSKKIQVSVNVPMDVVAWIVVGCSMITLAPVFLLSVMRYKARI